MSNTTGVDHYTYCQSFVNDRDFIQLDKFKKLCEKRLKLLRKIEECCDLVSESSNQNKKIIQLYDQIYQNSEDNLDKNMKYKEDNISHYLLRMSYCRTEELINWFVKQEKRLFRAQQQKFTLQQLQQSESIKFLKDDNIQIQQVDQNVWNQNYENIIVSSFSHNKQSDGQGNLKPWKSITFQDMKDKYVQTFYQNVPYLISQNKAFLHKGMAIIYAEDIREVYVDSYEKYLRSELLRIQKSISKVLVDKRIGGFLVNLNDMYFGESYNNANDKQAGKLNLSELEPLMKRGSIPLCMKELHSNLKFHSHLKHFGRQQLGLFLKGAGLSLQDSLTYWKRGFQSKTNAEEFEKKYAYNIKHNYGKEGKRTDYTPQSCNYIIKQVPGQNEHHGCPFKYMKKEALKKTLLNNGVKPEFLDKIIEKASGYHYQLACRSTFQAIHPEATDKQMNQIGNHPNSYISMSREYHSEIQDQQQKKQQNGENPIKQ